MFIEFSRFHTKRGYHWNQLALAYNESSDSYSVSHDPMASQFEFFQREVDAKDNSDADVKPSNCSMVKILNNIESRDRNGLAMKIIGETGHDDVLDYGISSVKNKLSAQYFMERIILFTFILILLFTFLQISNEVEINGNIINWSLLNVQHDYTDGFFSSETI